MQHTSLRTSSSPHARRGARLLLVALLGLLSVLAGCGSSASPGAPANSARLTPPPAQPATPVALLSLQMIDATSGWASRGPLSILHTTTGPQHWHDVTPGFQTGAPTAAVNDFLDGQHAWAGLALLPGADAPLHPFAIWHTSDGGQHWQQTQLHARGYEIGSIFFLTAQLGWLSVVRIVGEKTDALPALDIFRTQDGGLTWTLISSAVDSQHTSSGGLPMGVSGPSSLPAPPVVGSLATARSSTETGAATRSASTAPTMAVSPGNRRSCRSLYQTPSTAAQKRFSPSTTVSTRSCQRRW